MIYLLACWSFEFMFTIWIAFSSLPLLYIYFIFPTDTLQQKIEITDFSTVLCIE